MRVYLPATADDLDDPDGLDPRWAHTITGALRAALPDEDVEGLAEAAMLAAADESVERIRAQVSALPRRVVVAADVPGEDEPAGPGADERLPSAVLLDAPVPWAGVVSIHVDDADAADDVAAAIAGDDAALDRAAGRDLLWYDVVELDELRSELAR